MTELNDRLANNGGATASDACSGVTWSNDYDALSDDCGATGSATVTFTATDDRGNASSTTATFTIEDTTNPSLDSGFRLYSRVRRYGQHDGVERLARQQRRSYSF